MRRFIYAGLTAFCLLISVGAGAAEQPVDNQGAGDGSISSQIENSVLEKYRPLSVEKKEEEEPKVDPFESYVVPEGPFRFEKINSQEEMAYYILKTFTLDSTRADLQKTFIGEGDATLVYSPYEKGVEKYLYDINLCEYYIWRWNISADYDLSGTLLQAYINGNPVFEHGKPKRVVSKEPLNGVEGGVYKAMRKRPEARKGENELHYLLFDRDKSGATIYDQALVGGGPTRPDPVNMGKIIIYRDVEPWRSIFDHDEAKFIAPYSGDCDAADKAMKEMKIRSVQ